MTSFLQTDAWADFQRALGRRVVQVGETYAYEYDLPVVRKFYWYVPHTFAEALSPELVHELKAQSSPRDIFIKAEPLMTVSSDTAEMSAMAVPTNDALASVGFRPSAHTIQPSRSWVTDIQKSDAELLAAMHHKTRYDIRLAERRGAVSVNVSDDIAEFVCVLERTAERDRFHTHTTSYFVKFQEIFIHNSGGIGAANSNARATRPYAKLWLANYDGHVAAGALVMYYGDTVFYLHGAMDYTYRAEMAPQLMHWWIMQAARADGFKAYDWWGIDERRWPGVTRFKRSFGGCEVAYPGAFDLPLSRLWYLAYWTFARIITNT